MANTIEILEGRIEFYRTQVEYWTKRSDSWRKVATSLDQENDELRRENERLLSELAGRAPTVKVEALPEMCCGGTCVRAVCFIHGGGNG